MNFVIFRVVFKRGKIIVPHGLVTETARQIICSQLPPQLHPPHPNMMLDSGKKTIIMFPYGKGRWGWFKSSRDK